MHGTIIPKIINTLNAKSKEIKNHDVLPCGGLTAEVSVSLVRYGVNLEEKTCTCRGWQVTGKPCNHALAFIATLTREVNMEEFVYEYYSVERFRKAYAGTFKPMTSKHQWTPVNLGYKIKKPKLRRKPGRPRVARIRASDEGGTGKRMRCTECHLDSHTAKYCQGGLTASQKRRLIQDGQGSNEPSAAHTTNASDGIDDIDLGGGRPPTTRGRGRGRGQQERGRGQQARGGGRQGRGSGGRLAAWFGIDS
ncbi:hypothetical protein EJB05_31961, partial [Eragrostis curvula]